MFSHGFRRRWGGTCLAVGTLLAAAGAPFNPAQLPLEKPPEAVNAVLALPYLMEYPYECTEQTVSRFLPNIRTTAALRAAGLVDADLEENLKTQVNTGLQKLYAQQNPDGGWGWWGNQESDLLTSAYVVMALAEVLQKEVLVPHLVCTLK